MRTIGAVTLSLALLAPAAAPAQELIDATLFKDPYCGCCEGHAEHLRANGFDVTIVPSHDLSLIRQKHGIPADLVGCHTIEVGGYVVEGHVPADMIRKLLDERPDVDGIALPGMPAGSPGMGGPKSGPFTIYAFGAQDGEPQVFAVK